MLTRQQWGARAPRQAPTPVPIRSRSGFAVHYDGATPIVLRTLADVVAQVRKDQTFHMDTRGWNDIGYNFLVVSAPGHPAIDGLLVEGRGRDVVGAHCEGHNTAWIGVQVAIGGAQQPSAAALATVRKLYDECSAAHGSPLGKFGHRDGFATECPGPTLYAWVRAGMPTTTTQEDDMSAADVDAIERHINALVLTGYQEKTGGPVLPGLRPILVENQRRIDGLTAQVAGLSAAVKALAQSKPGVDSDAVIAAVTASFDRALADLSITLSADKG